MTEHPAYDRPVTEHPAYSGGTYLRTRPAARATKVILWVARWSLDRKASGLFAGHVIRTEASNVEDAAGDGARHAHRAAVMKKTLIAVCRDGLRTRAKLRAIHMCVALGLGLLVVAPQLLWGTTAETSTLLLLLAAVVVSARIGVPRADF